MNKNILDETKEVKNNKATQNYTKVIEALLYVQGESGLDPKQLKDVLSVPTLNARKLLQKFKADFNDEDKHGIQVMEFNDVFKFATKDELNEYVSTLVTNVKKQKLSSSAIETAGIIAYKQPITKGQINAIRGVASEGVVNTLLIKGIIEEKGIAKTPGNPVLFGITDKFYDYFGINSLKELPTLNEIDDTLDISEDFDLYQSQRNE